MTCSPKTLSILLRKLFPLQTGAIVDVADQRSTVRRYSVLLRVPKCSLFRTILPVFLVLVSLCTTPGMAEVDQFAAKNNEFALDLYSKIIQGKDNENVIFSPFSVQTCLALAHAGAGGKTAQELSTGLRLVSSDRAEVAKTFEKVLSQYKDSPLLKIANKVYVMTGHDLKPEFNEIALKSFYSEAENIDFGDSINAANDINKWVEQKTNEKIKELVSKDDLNSDTRAVLLNAIYFKGFWAKKFDKKLTQQEDFYTSETDTVKVDMMSMNAKFKYGEFEKLDASAIEMPYENSSLSMVILLPNKKTGLKHLESQLAQENLAELTDKMYETEVNLKLPRFKIEFSQELSEPLKQMGMNTMFSDTEADFSNLLKSPEPLKVSKVVHKAFIEVNEEGAEAAAATGVTIMAYSLQIPFEFNAVHPFLYILKDNTRNIFFMGKIHNPLVS